MGKSILFEDEFPDQFAQDSALKNPPNYSSPTPLELSTTPCHDLTSRSSNTIREETHSLPKGSLNERGLGSKADLGSVLKPAQFRLSDYKLVSNMFIGSMMVQYILIFFAIPFSEVDNRPAASVLSCLLGYLSFLLCVLMIPAGLINIPTKISFQSSLITCLLKTIDLGANVYSVVLCLSAKSPMIEYTFDQNRLPVSPLDITVYIQIVSCLLLVSSVISLFFAVVVFFFNFSYFRNERDSSFEPCPEK